jgi:hypothetical protein
MNTANLQLAGVLLVLDELLSTLRARGVVSRQEVDHLLARAAEGVDNDRQRVAALSAANAEAVAFPIRFLQAAGKAEPPRTYSSIAAAVGRAGGDDHT